MKAEAKKHKHFWRITDHWWTKNDITGDVIGACFVLECTACNAVLCPDFNVWERVYDKYNNLPKGD